MEAFSHHQQARWNHGALHRGLVVAREKAEAKAAKKARVSALASSEAGKTVAQRDKRYEKGTAEEIGRELVERYGLNLHNGSNAKRDVARRRKAIKDQYRKDHDYEALTAGMEQLRADARQMQAPVANVRGHTEYDIDDGSAQAKAARKVLGHVAAALDHLESQGFDVKAALSRGKVAYNPGNVGKSLGHAFQAKGTGYFTLSAGKASLDFMDNQLKNEERRRAANKPKWTAGANGSIADMQRTTAIHELTHALGMQPHINSPDKLGRILQRLFPDWSERRAWIKHNISEYATTNLLETDAELATLITSAEYQRGTLPKELEDHVDELFEHRGRDK